MKTETTINLTEFRAGRINGRQHHALSDYWRAENERKAKEAISDPDGASPGVLSYWIGYSDGMEFPE